MLWLREVDSQDVLRQAATVQLLAQLFRAQLTTVIDLGIKVGIALERQKPTWEAEILTTIAREASDLLPWLVLEGLASICCARCGSCARTFLSARVTASLSTRLIAFDLRSGRNSSATPSP